MSTIAIVDYGMCNLDSVARAVEKFGGTPLVTDQKKEIENAAGIILPGVGSFADAMQELHRRSLSALLQNKAKEGIPFLGICLGMQLMASTGYEGGETAGLNIIPGKVIRFIADDSQTRIPHVGWNEVAQITASPIFTNLTDNTDFYFVHSYHFQCADEFVLARTPYCGNFISVIGSGSAFGVQFHPEKSLKNGAKIITNFLALC